MRGVFRLVVLAAHVLAVFCGEDHAALIQHKVRITSSDALQQSDALKATFGKMNDERHAAEMARAELADQSAQEWSKAQNSENSWRREEAAAIQQQNSVAAMQVEVKRLHVLRHNSTVKADALKLKVDAALKEVDAAKEAEEGVKLGIEVERNERNLKHAHNKSTDHKETQEDVVLVASDEAENVTQDDESVPDDKAQLAPVHHRHAKWWAVKLKRARRRAEQKLESLTAEEASERAIANKAHNLMLETQFTLSSSLNLAAEKVAYVENAKEEERRARDKSVALNEQARQKQIEVDNLKQKMKDMFGSAQMTAYKAELEDDKEYEAKVKAAEEANAEASAKKKELRKTEAEAKAEAAAKKIEMRKTEAAALAARSALDAKAEAAVKKKELRKTEREAKAAAAAKKIEMRKTEAAALEARSALQTSERKR